MSIELITILFVATFVLLLLTGLPLAWVMGATGVIFCLALFSPGVMVMMVGRIYRMMLNYALVAVPLFIFMASILQQSGVADQLFNAVYIWSGPFRGGLAIGTIISCTIMAAIVGIVGAEIVTFGMIALPAMLERKYDHKIALGSICAGGGIATLIPPSVVFIVYAMSAGAPVGDLFIAGIIPGFMLSLLFIGYIVIAAWIKLATPSEAAGIGCLGALITSAINHKLTFSGIKQALFETVKISCMLAWLFFGAQAIIGIYTLAGGDEFVKSAVMSIPFGKWGILIGMQLIMIFLGMFLDWIGILLLTMPLFIPIITELGFDIVWFGVVFCMNMHISYLSPPFGPSIFYLKSVVGDEIPVGEIYRANLPYLWLTIVALALVIIFPQLSLWLPSMMLK